jgi:uncharacterized protein with NRDE domain
MCLIVFAYKAHPLYPFILLNNRDEFLSRSTLALNYWEDHPNLLGGRDKLRGGTWLGLSGNRFSALTNYRKPFAEEDPMAASRGELTKNYLLGSMSPESYVSSLIQSDEKYNGYNLLVGDENELWCYSNVNDEALKIEPGIYGVSNYLFDTPWPKLELAKQKFKTALGGDFSTQDLVKIMQNEQKFPDDELPDTGIGIEWERKLSSIFIKADGYGTKSTSVILKDNQGETTFVERSFDKEGGFEDKEVKF